MSSIVTPFSSPSPVLIILAICLLASACGRAPSDTRPFTVENDSISGIVVTSSKGLPYGPYGSPSSGGDALGKRIPCAPGTEPADERSAIPYEYRFEHPYPNPVYHPNPDPDGSLPFQIEFSLPCISDVTIAIIEEKPSKPFLDNISFETVNQITPGRVIWRASGTDVAPGVHITEPNDSGKPLNGFYRIYFQAGAYKAWHDVAIFSDGCLAPSDFKFACNP